MSDEKRYTERDLILAKREGARVALFTPVSGCTAQQAIDTANRLFPLPKVTRARVVRAKVGPFGFDWRLVKNTLEYANPEEEDWEPYKVERGEWADIAKILNDLLANPTEEVDE